MTTLPVAAGPFPVRAGRPRDDDWIPADNLLEAVSPLLEAYTGLLASVAFGSLLGAGRAPELAVGNVSVRLESGGVPDALAVHDPTPRAGDRLDRLEGVAASLLDRHLGVLVARLGAVRAGRGRRALGDWSPVAAPPRSWTPSSAPAARPSRRARSPRRCSPCPALPCPARLACSRWP